MTVYQRRPTCIKKVDPFKFKLITMYYINLRLKKRKNIRSVQYSYFHAWLSLLSIALLSLLSQYVSCWWHNFHPYSPTPYVIMCHKSEPPPPPPPSTVTCCWTAPRYGNLPDPSQHPYGQVSTKEIISSLWNNSFDSHKLLYLPSIDKVFLNESEATAPHTKFSEQFKTIINIDSQICIFFYFFWFRMYKKVDPFKFKLAITYGIIFNS